MMSATSRSQSGRALLESALPLPHISLMCGRYASFLPPAFIARLFGTANAVPNLPPTWNMAPRRDAPVVRRHPETGERHLDALNWGLVPHFTKELREARRPINARSETVATSGMFKTAFAKRRCLVPAAAFYEWRSAPDGKIPYAIARADGDPLAFAGIWEGWRSPDGEVLRSFAILTTAANEQLSMLHDRMPVILEPADWPVWLGEVEGDPSVLLHPAAESVLRLWPVDKRVGNVRNDGPELLEPHVPPEPAPVEATAPNPM
jgi:putative SOS response-associated peptidase YedK